MPPLVPDSALELPGVRVRSIGVAGQVDAVPLDAGGGRGDVRDLDEELGRVGVPDDGARALARAVTEQDMRAVLVVPLDDLATLPGAGADRGVDEGPSIELTVDAPADDEAQVVLEIDAAGVVSWHWAAADGATGDRGGLEQVFHIPVRQTDVPGEDLDHPGDRALFGIGTKKLLQVLRYPIERAAAAGGRALITRWEDRARPYRLRRIDGGEPDLAALAGRPALLLVHGTFSTCASGFDGLLKDAAFVAEMQTRYAGGVLLFDHPSLHVDPTANARWLLEQLPPDTDLAFDVVAHSRGGLVARALASGPLAADAGRRPPALRNVLHVATPNAGTVLADTERWGKLLDTVTNLLMLFPDDTVSVPLTAVVETVKHIGTGIAGGLDGLAAMVPHSHWLSALGPPAVAGHAYSIASNFDPVSAPLPVRALNVLVDPFFGEDNDLVVPTKGVSTAAGLTVEDTLVLPQTPAVAHTTYFRDEEVRAAVANWLPRSD